MFALTRGCRMGADGVQVYDEPEILLPASEESALVLRMVAELEGELCAKPEELRNTRLVAKRQPVCPGGTVAPGPECRIAEIKAGPVFLSCV